MEIISLLKRGDKRKRKNDEYISTTKVVNGPSSYTTGGFEVETKGIRKIKHSFVIIENDNTTYKLETTNNGNKIKIKVNEISYDSSSSSLVVNEIQDGTDLSGKIFIIVVYGL